MVPNLFPFDKIVYGDGTVISTGSDGTGNVRIIYYEFNELLGFTEVLSIPNAIYDLSSDR